MYKQHNVQWMFHCSVAVHWFTFALDLWWCNDSYSEGWFNKAPWKNFLFNFLWWWWLWCTANDICLVMKWCISCCGGGGGKINWFCLTFRRCLAVSYRLWGELYVCVVRRTSEPNTGHLNVTNGNGVPLSLTCCLSHTLVTSRNHRSHRSYQQHHQCHHHFLKSRSVGLFSPRPASYQTFRSNEFIISRRTMFCRIPINLLLVSVNK